MAGVAYAASHPSFVGSLLSPAVRKPERVASPALPRLDNLDVEIDPKTRTCWCYMHPQERASFTPELLADMARLQGEFGRMFSDAGGTDLPPRYLVVGSHVPGVFNLGGDLGLFADLIRSGDAERLRRYARACIDVIHKNSVAYSLPMVTIAMVQGDALGGGFEAALSCDMIVAERSAKFGLPEILFNLFPGMGAYSFLSRRLGPIEAEKMIVSGKIYDAAELRALGLIDLLVDDGEAPAAIRSYIARHVRRHNAEQAVHRVRRLVNPVPYEELAGITDIWVETAMRLTESDLRKMERITMAQNRRWAALPASRKAKLSLASFGEAG
jgi:DSF synthase